MTDQEQLEEAQREQINYYKKLSHVKDSDEFKVFFDFIMKTATDKMLWVFLNSKEGDNVKSWDEFCKARGEIIARLHIIQEVYGADVMAKHLKRQLDEYYKNE